MPLSEIPISYNTLKALIGTPTVPARYRSSATGVNDMLAAVLTGREIGIGPMESINSIYLVNGQVAMSGKLMSALVHRAGHQIRLDIKDKSVTATAYRRDYVTHELTKVGEVTFSEADAKKAGLAAKDTYKAYPKIMMGWRAITALCRFYFGDVVSGMAAYVPEEVNIPASTEPIPEDTELVVDGEEIALDNAVMEVVDALDAEVIGT
jgi:hypothetical protein